MTHTFRLIGFLFTALLLVSSCKETHIDKKRPDGKNLDVIMHRGVHVGGVAPENSLDALEMAARVGATTVEIDIKMTADGYFVLSHDDEITNEFFRNAADYSEIKEPVNYNTLTLAELRSKYVFASPNPAMRRPTPTLEEALFVCKNKDLFPFIEIKRGFSTETIKEAYDLTVKIMGKGNFGYTSLGPWVVEHLRKQDAEMELSCDPIQDIDVLLKMRLNYLPYYKEVIDENVNQIHANGLRAFAWTIPKEEFDLFVDKKLDGIFSDDIAPIYKREYSIFHNYTDGVFSKYSVEGEITDNVVNLKKGQTIELKETQIDNLYLGAMYFSVETKGKIKIEANGFNVDREVKHDDYKAIRFQYMFHNQKPFFKVTALEDNVSIKSIWLAINEF